LGGWVANDEACPVFEEIITNIMVGHEFFYRELKIDPPKTAWLVDSFGHSAGTPELFQKMGFDSIFFSRVNDLEKDNRKQKKELEFIWKPSFEGTKGSYPSR
jgi:hypothetical protein